MVKPMISLARFLLCLENKKRERKKKKITRMIVRVDVVPALAHRWRCVGSDHMASERRTTDWCSTVRRLMAASCSGRRCHQRVLGVVGVDAGVAHAVCERNDGSVTTHDSGGDGRQRLVTMSRQRADDRREETRLAVARARRVGRPSRHLRRQDSVEARLAGHQRWRIPHYVKNSKKKLKQKESHNTRPIVVCLV